MLRDLEEEESGGNEWVEQNGGISKKVKLTKLEEEGRFQDILLINSHVTHN